MSRLIIFSVLCTLMKFKPKNRMQSRNRSQNRNSRQKSKPLIFKSVTGLSTKAKNMRSLTYTAFILMMSVYLTLTDHQPV